MSLPVACLVPLESPWLGGVYGLGSMKFGCMVKKLLIFKVYFGLKNLKLRRIRRT